MNPTIKDNNKVTASAFKWAWKKPEEPPVGVKAIVQFYWKNRRRVVRDVIQAARVSYINYLADIRREPHLAGVKYMAELFPINDDLCPFADKIDYQLGLRLAEGIERLHASLRTVAGKDITHGQALDLYEKAMMVTSEGDDTLAYAKADDDGMPLTPAPCGKASLGFGHTVVCQKPAGHEDSCEGQDGHSSSSDRANQAVAKLKETIETLYPIERDTFNLDAESKPVVSDATGLVSN